MFNNFRDNSSGSYPAPSQSQIQGQPHSDSFNQTMGQMQNSLRNLTNYTQYTAQQQGTTAELMASTLRDGFKTVGDSVNNLSKQIEINNKITLFTLNTLFSGNAVNGDSAIQEQEKRRAEEFRKLANYIGNIDANMSKELPSSISNGMAAHSNQNRSSSGSRTYSSASAAQQQQAINSQTQQQSKTPQQIPQPQQQPQVSHRVNSSRKELAHRGSSTSLSASLKSNITPPNATQRAVADKRQYQAHVANQRNSQAVPSPVSQQKNMPQVHARARTSSQLASLDSSSPESLSKKQKKSYKDHEPIYVLTQPSKVSIREAWLEYTVGLNGSPAVRDLENQYKTRWRGGSNHTISKQYTNRIAFYKFLEDMEAQNSVEFGIKFLEEYCAKNEKKNLRWLQFNMPSEAEFRRYSFEHRGTSM